MKHENAPVGDRESRVSPNRERSWSRRYAAFYFRRIVDFYRESSTAVLGNRPEPGTATASDRHGRGWTKIEKYRGEGGQRVVRTAKGIWRGSGNVYGKLDFAKKSRPTLWLPSLFRPTARLSGVWPHIRHTRVRARNRPARYHVSTWNRITQILRVTVYVARTSMDTMIPQKWVTYFLSNTRGLFRSGDDLRNGMRGCAKFL